MKLLEAFYSKKPYIDKAFMFCYAGFLLGSYPSSLLSI